ncbi:MAG: Gfo/Idh/MocA family oxidoreductase, partial [Planctomycetales bacterium]|nr:Gfo/Idh/MocA family oxidoreductase [Planctomycetales bacterium]
MHKPKDDMVTADRPSSPEGGDGFSRRDFLRGGVAAGVVGGVGLGAVYFGYESSVRDPVRVGIIGTGDEGGVLIGAINPAYVQVVAIADIRPYNIYRAFHGDESSPAAAEARPGLIQKYGYADEGDARRQIAVYTDGYEALLDDPHVEGVIIALPLHLHAAASIKAMRKGKHVLCEKLMA